MSPTLELTAAALTIALVAFALGYLAGRHRRRELVDEAADRTLEALIARQVDTDRRALDSLPPGVSASDAVRHAAYLGISVDEAALDLFRTQARARLDANLARHHRRRRS